MHGSMIEATESDMTYTLSLNLTIGRNTSMNRYSDDSGISKNTFTPLRGKYRLWAMHSIVTSAASRLSKKRLACLSLKKFYCLIMISDHRPSAIHSTITIKSRPNSSELFSGNIFSFSKPTTSQKASVATTRQIQHMSAMLLRS